MASFRAFLLELYDRHAVEPGIVHVSNDGQTILEPVEFRPDQLPEPWRDWYEERAAIREFDGGQPRHEAEAAAMCEVAEAMRRAGA